MLVYPIGCSGSGKKQWERAVKPTDSLFGDADVRKAGVEIYMVQEHKTRAYDARLDRVS